MSAYVVLIRDKMRDEEKFAEYGKAAGEARGDHEITPLAFYGECEVLEGAGTDGVVILQFPTMDAARAWYNSEGYTKARLIRHAAADYRAVLVNGL